MDVEGEILDVPFFDWDDVLEQRLAEARSPRREPNFFEKTLLEWYEDWDPRGHASRRDAGASASATPSSARAPGELFVEWGLEMKKWSPFPYTFIAELANDSVGYIPTYEAFRRGGYETTPVVQREA